MPAILITGGSGYLGSQLVSELSAQGETVVSMYRHRLPEPRERVFPVCSDLSAAELLAAPLRGVHTVVHLAWERNFLGPEASPGSEQAGSSAASSHNLRLLANLIKAMEKARTRRMIFVSALGASHQADDPFLAEKYRGEFQVLNSQVPEKIILRPALVYGGDATRDRFIAAVRRVMRFPGVYPLPRCPKSLHPLHIEDLVALIAKLVGAPLSEPVALLEQRGAEAFLVDELFRLVGARYQKGARLVLGRALGHWLVPLFEKEGRSERFYPRLRHFLAMGQELNTALVEGNPLGGLLSQSKHSFREAMQAIHAGEETARAKAELVQH